MIPRTAFLVVLLALPAVLAGCTEPAADPPASPYVDQLDSDIRGLSSKEIEELRTGAGMGLARPAELNGYPGPLHVLELASQLSLSEQQRADVQAVREAMLAEAIPVGEQILNAYAALETAFRDGSIDADTLRMRLEHLEALEADLRFIHLKAHLDTLPLLTQHQRVRYSELRGYTAEGEHAHEGH